MRRAFRFRRVRYPDRRAPRSLHPRCPAPSASVGPPRRTRRRPMWPTPPPQRPRSCVSCSGKSQGPGAGIRRHRGRDQLTWSGGPPQSGIDIDIHVPGELVGLFAHSFARLPSPRPRACSRAAARPPPRLYRPSGRLAFDAPRERRLLRTWLEGSSQRTRSRDHPPRRVAQNPAQPESAGGGVGGRTRELGALAAVAGVGAGAVTGAAAVARRPSGPHQRQPATDWAPQPQRAPARWQRPRG